MENLIKFCLWKFCILACGLAAAEPILATLSPAEADAIIAQREAAKTERKAARHAELNRARVLSEGETILPDGSKAIVREVAPPETAGAVLAQPESGHVATITPSFTPEQQAWMEAQAKLQTHKVLMLSCTVYDRSITEVRWKFEGEDYLAYTNADFNFLRGIMDVSTETDRYEFFFAVGNASSEQRKEPLPHLPDFSSSRSEYFLTLGDPAHNGATAGLEALLAHYDANLNKLRIAYQRSQALAAAQKRYDEQNPEEPEDFIFQFWVPEQERAK